MKPAIRPLINIWSSQVVREYTIRLHGGVTLNVRAGMTGKSEERYYFKYRLHQFCHIEIPRSTVAALTPGPVVEKGRFTAKQLNRLFKVVLMPPGQQPCYLYANWHVWKSDQSIFYCHTNPFMTLSPVSACIITVFDFFDDKAPLTDPWGRRRAGRGQSLRRDKEENTLMIRLFRRRKSPATTTPTTARRTTRTTPRQRPTPEFPAVPSADPGNVVHNPAFSHFSVNIFNDW